MNYKIINSGSDGNATIIEDAVLIDCGVSFKKLKDDYQHLMLVLLTHIHIDHFNKKTISRLAKERPLLRFGCCEWLVRDLIDCGVDKRNIDIYNFEEGYCYNSILSVEPIKLYHDVSQCGYKLFINNKKIIYATDTNSLDEIVAKDFDLYLIEGNYENEMELHERAYSSEYEERVKMTHLSKEYTLNWLLKNMGDNSKYEFMHQHKEKSKKV